MAVQQSHENDTLEVYNPTNRDFTVKWGGVPRTIKANSGTEYPRFLAEHIAKHLADFILQVKQYQYKKEHGKDVVLIRNRKEREKVLRLIIRGVKSYFLPATPDGSPIGDQIQPMTPEEQRSLLDIGDVEDSVLGNVIDDIEIETVPEAQLPENMTKQQVMDQLAILGVEYSDRETKPELLKKMGVIGANAQDLDKLEISDKA